jgi:hypothetical protein
MVHIWIQIDVANYEAEIFSLNERVTRQKNGSAGSKNRR